MSSLFDVPAQLVLILTLAASGGGAPPAREFPRPAIVAAAGETGPYAFREQVWLEAIESGSGGEALATEQRRVFRTSNGRYYVPSEIERWRVLTLRQKPEAAARVAYGFARRNSERMGARLSRAPAPGELYLAHALGSETALALIEAAAATPDAPLYKRLPELAQRHPELGKGRGRPATVAEAARRLKQAAERRPSGEEVAAWFSRGEITLLAGDLKGRIEETASIGEEAPRGWAAAVSIAP